MAKSLSNGSFCCCATPIRGWQIVFEIFFLVFWGECGILNKVLEILSIMNTTINYLCDQFRFFQTSSDCASSGLCSMSISQVTGIGDNPEEMSPFQKILFDIAENFAQAIQQAGNAARSSGVAHAVASVGKGATNMWQQFNAAMRGRQAQMSLA